MRINFDLESERGILNFRAFIDQAADLVVAYGGSLSGEHGDGQARGALLPKMFGPELMTAFRAFKRLWDPLNRMNPGKLIDAREPHRDLRLGADYHPIEVQTHFTFPHDAGSLAQASLRCVGVGACRKTDAGVMCPSYMATRDEQHSTRGRARLLWEMLQGEVLEDGWKNEACKEALDLCLSCKACKTECPTGVDLATYKAEFLSHYYAGRRRPLHAYAFGLIDRWARAASWAPRAANALAAFPPGRRAAAAVLNLEPSRRLPRFASTTFRSRMRRRGASGPGSAGARPAVLLWADTFTNYFQPEIAEAAYTVLTGAGFEVRVPERHVCCGRPLYDFGMLDRAKRYLREVMHALDRELADGTPIVVLEPSCASVFRDEAPNLLADDPRAARLAVQTKLLSELLTASAPPHATQRFDGRILLHVHCHHRALFDVGAEVRALKATGAEVALLDAGCCGMAGPFGFERKSAPVAARLGERVLLPAVRAAAADTLVVSGGFSCREQIAQNTNRRALHPAEVLAGAFETEE